MFMRVTIPGPTRQRLTVFHGVGSGLRNFASIAFGSRTRTGRNRKQRSRYTTISLVSHSAAEIRAIRCLRRAFSEDQHERRLIWSLTHVPNDLAFKSCCKGGYKHWQKSYGTYRLKRDIVDAPRRMHPPPRSCHPGCASQRTIRYTESTTTRRNSCTITVMPPCIRHRNTHTQEHEGTRMAVITTKIVHFPPTASAREVADTRERCQGETTGEQTRRGWGKRAGLGDVNSERDGPGLITIAAAMFRAWRARSSWSNE